MRRPPWFALSFAATVAVAVAQDVGGTSPLRTLLVVWFLVTCPGMALARLIDLETGFGEASVGIGLSISINTLLALALVYLGLWSPDAVFAVTAAVTLAAAIGGFGRIRGDWP